MSALGGCTVIVLSGPGTRSRQLHIPRGFPLWVVLVSLLSVTGSLFAGRQARAWFDPATPIPGLLQPTTRQPGLAEWQVAQHLELARDERAPRGASASTHRKHETGPASELSLLNVNGAHTIRVRPFAASGAPDPNAFEQLKEFMRCRRTGQAHDMNPRLVALLTRIASHFDGAVLHLISAHRTADDVVTRPSSQHARGTAADIRIPGVSIETLARTARELGAHGIGIYPESRFVHVDVRDQPYYWRDLGEGPVAMREPL